MKAAPLLVQWHNDGNPIYSAHFEPHGKGRLATAGGDNNVRVGGPTFLQYTTFAYQTLALENRLCRRRTESYLSLYAFQAFRDSQRGAMVSERCVVPKEHQVMIANEFQVK